MASAFTDFDRIADVFRQVLDSSVADETELVWFERRYGAASVGPQWAPPLHDRTGGDDAFPDRPLLSVLVRVVQGGRLGWHRTHVGDANELESGVRQALAVATARPALGQRPVLPTGTRRRGADGPRLHDPGIAALDVESARALLRDARGEDDALSAHLDWSETRIAVANSHGVRRRTSTTEASLQVRCGAGVGCGFATASARRLDDLSPPSLVERARERSADSSAPNTLDTDGEHVVLLAPEAVAVLLDVLNVFAFAGRAYLDGTSFLARHRNVQVFDRSLHLVDDATRASGLPFPFDLEGSAKEPIELIVDGRPSTPALDKLQSTQAGLAATAHSVGGTDALFGNLFLEPGDASWPELLERAGTGLWIGWLEPPECVEPSTLTLRTTARGVRRIENGRLGAPVPDLRWQQSLLGALARLRAVGADSAVRVVPSTPLGAVAAPALLLESVTGLRVAP
ncbi:MAG: metallopeptidase TldD-related protein [Acidobacteriota bacterium]